MAAVQKSSKSTQTSSGVSWVRWRPQVWGGLLLVLVVGLAGHFAWQHFGTSIAEHPQYRITADQIHITPAPAWIRADVKAEAIHAAGLAGRLSVLDDGAQLQRRVRDAFGLHPWVAEVKQIRVGLPASLDVEVIYRRPAAVVEVATDAGPAYLPIDVAGVRLPDADFSEVERRMLPRISGVSGRPAVGAAWSDSRVLDGARLVASMGDVWDQLRLVEVVPSSAPQVRGGARYYTFEITTSGGTRIVWGVAPGAEKEVNESPFDVKRRRLLDFAAEHGQLDSIDGPERVDVRSELVVLPRTARRAGPTDESAQPTK